MDREPFWIQMIGSQRDESSRLIKIGWSSFAMKRHQKGEGNSYFEGTWDMPIRRVQDGWSKRYPGQGETCLTRKVVVPVDPKGFFTSRVALSADLPVQCEVKTRQEGEDPYPKRESRLRTPNDRIRFTNSCHNYSSSDLFVLYALRN